MPNPNPSPETRFKKGESGNPGGRPNGSISLTAVVRRKLAELSPDNKRQAIEHLADNIIQDALDYNNRMRTLIWQYMDGMPNQKVDVTSDGKPILGGITQHDKQERQKGENNEE